MSTLRLPAASVTMYLSHILVVAGLGFAVRTETTPDMDSVIFASVVFRHGDRAPLYTFPTDTYSDVEQYWPQGPGQLTEVGEEEQLELGQFLRARYSHLLPAVYHANHSFTRSTTIDRALLSAECTLAGLYPPHRRDVRHVTFQPVPVHSAEMNHDTLMLPHLTCPRITELVAQVRRSRELLCVRKLTAKLRQDVARCAGVAQFASQIYDTLYIQDLYNLRLPDWARLYYPSPLRQIHLLENFVAPVATSQLQRLAAGPLLRQLSQDMKDKLSGALSSARALHLYSGHDFNVIGVLHALGVYNGLIVPYSSAVIFELHRRDDNNYVAVWYRNDTKTGPTLLQLEGCESLCPEHRFQQLVYSLISHDWEAECVNSTLQPDIPQNLLVPPAAILPEWSHCFSKMSLTTNKDDVL